MAVTGAGGKVAAVTELPVVSFAELLKRLRTDAGLTQEGLAERASVSPRSISDLERGINKTARQDTTRLLADALNLSGTARAGFETAARGNRDAEPEGLPKKSSGVVCEGESVKFAFITEMDEENDRKPREERFPVMFMCEMLEVSRQGYYAWKKRAPSARQKKM